jgi:hypothetical protein
MKVDVTEADRRLAMFWKTLEDARAVASAEFGCRVASMHHFVRVADGSWTRIFGSPDFLCSNLIRVDHDAWHFVTKRNAISRPALEKVHARPYSHAWA